MKYVKAIGLEIEGGWFSTDDKPSRLCHWHNDESVRNIRRTQNGREVIFVGEAASIPLTDLDSVRQWIKTFWPDRKNESCGFHIHTSFDSKNYGYLVNEEFYINFFHEMRKIGEKLNLCKEYFSRLEGKNHHCQRIFKGHEQIKATSKTNNRYTQLNYCYSLHGTLENRLPCAMLPLTKAYSYVEEYINFIENFLDKHPKKELDAYFWKDSFEIEDKTEISS